MAGRLPSKMVDRIEIVDIEHEADFIFTLRFKDGCQPRSIRKRMIGELITSKRSPHFSHGPWLPSLFQRRGFGTMLHVHAMRYFGMISVDWHTASELGKIAWRSLMRKYPHEIDLGNSEVTVYYRSMVPVF